MKVESTDRAHLVQKRYPQGLGRSISKHSKSGSLHKYSKAEKNASQREKTSPVSITYISRRDNARYQNVFVAAELVYQRQRSSFSQYQLYAADIVSHRA